MLLWIKEFLNNRSFAVKLNNYLSKSLPVISSVPQGSKLGPLLYILYANDIMQNFKFAKVKMYADDLTVYAIVNNINDRIKLQNELNNLLEWSKNGNLILILINVMLFTLVKKIYISIITLII